MNSNTSKKTNGTSAAPMKTPRREPSTATERTRLPALSNQLHDAWSDLLIIAMAMDGGVGGEDQLSAQDYSGAIERICSRLHGVYLDLGPEIVRLVDADQAAAAGKVTS